MNDERTNQPGDELEDERLRRLLAAAAQLPTEAAVPNGTWDLIRTRIDTGRVRSIAPGGANGGTTHTSRTHWWWLTAAAVVLVAVSVTFQPARRGKAMVTTAHDSSAQVATTPFTPSPDSSSSPLAGGPAIAVPVAVSSANPALAAALDQYHAATRELEAEVAAHTAALPPATREVVRRSLATIDSAITDLRMALGSDPRNASVGQYLGAMYEQKLDFLKRVRAIPAAGM